MNCKHTNMRCVDTRMKKDYRYRRHECKDCGKRLTSIEMFLDDKILNRRAGALSVMKEQIRNITPEQIKAIKQLVESFGGVFCDE